MGHHRDSRGLEGCRPHRRGFHSSRWGCRRRRGDIRGMGGGGNGRQVFCRRMHIGGARRESVLLLEVNAKRAVLV